jgi:hypothetical protein
LIKNLKFKIKNSQKGVSLIIVFLIMTIMLAIVFGISTVLINEIVIIRGIGNSVASFYSADTGIEKTLYFDRKQVVSGANRGFCNICTTCNDSGLPSEAQCNNCVATPLALDGCDVNNCTNCQVNYDSSYLNRSYAVSASVTPNTDPLYSDTSINSKGVYQDLMREIQLRATTPTIPVEP